MMVRGNATANAERMRELVRSLRALEARIQAAAARPKPRNSTRPAS